HGYDPAIVQMHGIFFAWGAGVKPGEIKRLDQIDVHPTVMKLLGLQPGRPVDGHPVARCRRHSSFCRSLPKLSSRASTARPGTMNEAARWVPARAMLTHRLAGMTAVLR